MVREIGCERGGSDVILFSHLLPREREVIQNSEANRTVVAPQNQSHGYSIHGRISGFLEKKKKKHATQSPLPRGFAVP